MVIKKTIFLKNIYLAVLSLSCGMWDLSWWRMDSSCGTPGSVVGGRRFSCSAACGILVLWPRIKPASSVLQGGFLTTRPPVKSQDYF